MIRAAGAPRRLTGGLVAAEGGGDPTVLRIMLGAQLRRLREEKGISLAEAGQVIRASHSKVSRLETGRVGFKDRDLADLLTCYGVTDPRDREAVRSLALRASTPGWWHDYSDVLPGWLEAYVGLEEAASQIRSYEIQFVPGLLQTREYAHAVTALGHPCAAAGEIGRRVSLRMARQAVLDRADPPHLWAVLDEAVLRRSFAGPDVMRAQLRHLMDMAQRPNVTLQVVPFASGAPAAGGGPFSVLRFAGPDLPDVVYLEQLTSALYLDRPETVDHYLMVLERVCVDAATPADSIAVIEALLRGH